MPEPQQFNAYSTLTAEVAPTFATQVVTTGLRRPDGTFDPQEREHLRSMAAYVGAAAGDDHRDALLDHIDHVWWHYRFEVPENRMADLAEWAERSNSLLYGAAAGLTDPQSRPLLDEATGRVPVTPAAIERARAQRLVLQRMGVSVPSAVRPLHAEPETLPRPAREIALRALALALTSYFAGAVLTKKPSQLNDDDMRRDYPQSFDAMSEREQEVFRTRDRDLAAELGWDLAAAESLLWALGAMPARLPDAPPPGGDVIEAAFSVSEENFLTRAALRPLGELLDEAEREHALRGAADANSLSGSGFQPRVIAGRDRALRWLLDPRLDSWDDLR